MSDRHPACTRKGCGGKVRRCECGAALGAEEITKLRRLIGEAQIYSYSSPAVVDKALWKALRILAAEGE